MTLLKGSNITLILGIVISLVIGFLVGNASSGTYKNGISMPSLQSGNPIFTTQSATVQGKINKVEGNKITVTNLSGNQGEFELSEMTVINKIVTNSNKLNTATSSTDLSTLETDKDVSLILQLKDGKYVVLSVNYTPPALPLPSLPPIPKK